MEKYPPSYESATSWDAWLIIAHYIPSTDLCAAALVSRKWHKIFLPFLWGAPASHFGKGNDAVYVALIRFKRTLKHARLSVRMLTHTVHLPPALSEIYSGPRPEWLKDLLDYLPCLQSLIVSELPFFDHNATIALRPVKGKEGDDNRKTYNLRLLLAQNEPNITSVGLASALARFAGLVYLDLSYTTSARDRLVLSTFSELRDLQILKLRGIGMKDQDADFLAKVIGVRVRLLDLRNNMLSDRAVQSLLQYCFLSQEEFELQMRAEDDFLRRVRQSNGVTSWPHLDDFLKQPNVDEKTLGILTSPLTGRSVIENLPHVGITHLYLADNQLSVQGVASLISGTRINVLDVGTVNTAKSLTRIQISTTEAATEETSDISSGPEKLIPLLATYSYETLTCLRINHSILTRDTPMKDAPSVHDFVAELAARDEMAQLERVHLVSELEGSNLIAELPADTAAQFELADTTVSPNQITPNTPTSCNSNRAYQVDPLPAGREPAITLELTSSIGDDEPRPPSPGTTIHPTSHTDRRLSVAPEPLSTLSYKDCASSRLPKIYELLSKRPKDNLPSEAKQKYPPYLHPCHLPHLDTLILTDVPSHVEAGSSLIDSLVRFITACSDEAMLATLQVRSDYSLPPGRARILAEQQYARSLFGLRKIVLEVRPAIGKNVPPSSAGWKSTHHDHHMITKSSTGDLDSERMWTAASEDFSFFGNEECGIPDDDDHASRSFPMAILNDRVCLGLDDTSSELEAPLSPKGKSGIVHNPIHELSGSRPLPNLSQPHPEKQTAQDDKPSWFSQNSPPSRPEEQLPVDVVSTLAAFRKRKKVEFEENLTHHMEQERIHPSASMDSTHRAVAGSPKGDCLAIGACSTSLASPMYSVPVYVSGHWKGEVTVIRHPTSNGHAGVVDIYGNYFEKGYKGP